MKLLEVSVTNVRGVPDGTHVFTEADGSPRRAVVLVGGVARVLLATIAALLEAVRAPTPVAGTLQWWAAHRGPGEARLTARWALSAGEAARVGASDRSVTSEWRLGPGDPQPRELRVDGAPSLCSADPAVASYAYLDAHRGACWVVPEATDPLAEILTGMVERTVAASRARYRPSVRIVATHAPNTFGTLNAAIARVLPDLRIARIACGRNEIPVACFRRERRVALDELESAERDALYIVAVLHAANLRDGVVLVDRPELHVAPFDYGRWLAWIAGLTATNQLFVATPTWEPPNVGSAGADPLAAAYATPRTLA